jgi:hypothetical protein
MVKTQSNNQKQFIDYHEDVLLELDHSNKKLISLADLVTPTTHSAFKQFTSPIPVEPKSRCLQFMVAQYTRLFKPLASIDANAS